MQISLSNNDLEMESLIVAWGNPILIRKVSTILATAHFGPVEDASPISDYL